MTLAERHWRILGFDAQDDRLRFRAALVDLSDEAARALLGLPHDDDLLGEYPLTPAMLDAVRSYLPPHVMLPNGLNYDIDLGRGAAPAGAVRLP